MTDPAVGFRANAVSRVKWRPFNFHLKPGVRPGRNIDKKSINPSWIFKRAPVIVHVKCRGCGTYFEARRSQKRVACSRQCGVKVRWL